MAAHTRTPRGSCQEVIVYIARCNETADGFGLVSSTNAVSCEVEIMVLTLGAQLLGCGLRR